MTLGTSDLAVWRKMSQAAADGFLSQFADADARLGEAQALAERFHPELLGEVALRKGTLCFLRDDSAHAALAYRDSLRIAREQKDPFLEAAALGSLGLTAAQQEHYDESIQWNTAALSLAQSIGARTSATKTLGNMAWSYFELGDYENSRALFQQAEESAAKEGNLGDQLLWRINVGSVDSYRRDFGDAESEIRSALNLARQQDQNVGIAQSLRSLSDIDLARDRLDAADSENREALRLSRAAQDRNGELASTITAARIEGGRHNRQRAVQILNGVITDPAATSSLRWEAQARLASVYADAGNPAAAEREFRGAVDTLEAARRSVQSEELRIPFLANAAELYDDYLEFLVSQNRAEDALRLAALTRARTLVEGLGLDPEKGLARLTPEDWKGAARRQDAVILCYWLGSRHSYLWAILPSGRLKIFFLAPAEQIDAAVQSYAGALLGPRDVLQTANSSGTALYKMLVAPAQDLIPKGSRVVIVPDGSLCGLNFETLLAPEPVPHYWIEDATITYSDSLILVAAARRATATMHGKLLLIGDPVSPGSDFPQLPQAAAEMASIEKYFPSPDTRVLSGSSATAQAYVDSNPGQFAFIHFVAHGTSSRARPLESAVILSRQGDSFKLYGRDVVRHPLKAELVTISACHGVGSRNYSGEGLVGLSWAFLRAGARSVIAALWDVNDASTARLMGDLYGQMSKGKDPAVALRNAKLALLHSNGVYQRPFYWAPFQYYIGL